jgi:hypothetical protein
MAKVKANIADRTCPHVLGSHVSCLHVLRHVLIFLSLGSRVLRHVFMSLGSHILVPWDKNFFTKLCVNVPKLTSPRPSIFLVVGFNVFEFTSIES